MGGMIQSSLNTVWISHGWIQVSGSISIDMRSVRSVQSRLDELHLSGQYLRVSGVDGDPNEAASHGLKPGEWGAWQGWIRMLNKASIICFFVHLMEDDVDISDMFPKLVQDELLRGLLALAESCLYGCLCLPATMFSLA